MLLFPTRGRLTGVHPNSSLLGFSAALAFPKFHPCERRRNPMPLRNLSQSQNQMDALGVLLGALGVLGVLLGCSWVLLGCA